MVALIFCLASSSAGFAKTIDNFSKPAAWRAVGEAPAPSARAEGGMKLEMPFQSGLDRVYWDRDGAWDFSSASSFDLELSCDQPSAIRSLAIYFRSGKGWYIWSKPLAAAGRQKLTLSKSDFQTEGTPAGWNKIDKIRISPWKGQSHNASLIMHALATRSDRLYLVQATASAPNDAERGVAKRTTERLSRWMTASGIGHTVITEDELARAAAGASLIVFPYNPKIPAAGMKALRAYADRGGKLIVFYSSDDQLAKLMQVSLGAAQTTRDIARWRSMAFTPDAPRGLPARIHQQSWSIGPAQPATKQGRIIARWANAGGTASSEPAIIATPRGYWFTHILLDDDSLAKQRMLTVLLGQLAPDCWREAAGHARLNAGRIDGWRNATEAMHALDVLGQSNDNRETIAAFTRRIQQQHDAMQAHYAAGRYREATLSGYEVTALLIKAYGLAQRPAKGEFRAVWDHDATGWYPGDWERTAELMADSGINAVFVNATWAGLAHYKSEQVPSSFTCQHYGDQLEQAIRACRKYGIEVHAWLVCWTLENSREEFTKPLRKTDRLQRMAGGGEKLWMNPAHPANTKHHLDLIAEILARYDVDGIHLDYIRYPDSSSCFSGYTRQRFEHDSDRAVADWPADVRHGGARHGEFTRWRAGIITAFVRQTRALVREKKPEAKLSAAVWGGYPEIVTSIGQDWGAWMKEGLLDFVTPMNYAQELYRFTALIDQQLPLPGVRGRIFPGIGVTANESQLRGDQVIEQILALRQRGVGGFALFDLSQTLVDDTLPALRLGITRP